MPDDNELQSTERRVVSHHPLRPIVERENAFQAILGFLAMLAVTAALVAVLYGKLSFEGSFVIQGLGVPWIIVPLLLAPLIYKHQSYVTMVRPTGEGSGFWFGLLDFFPSLLAFLAAALILAGVIVHWFPDIEKGWHEHAGFIPIAPYTLTSAVVGLVFTFYGWLDLRGFHWNRAKYGREEQLARVAQTILPPDKAVVIVDKPPERRPLPHSM